MSQIIWALSPELANLLQLGDFKSNSPVSDLRWCRHEAPGERGAPRPAARVFLSLVCLKKKNNDLFWDFERPSLFKSKNKVRLSAETKSTTSSLNPSIIYVGSSKCRANVPLSKYHTRISYSGPWAHWIKVMWNNLRELKKSWISWMLPLLKLYVPSAQMTKWQK